MAGLDPAIHAARRRTGIGMDARIKSGHDEESEGLFAAC